MRRELAGPMQSIGVAVRGWKDYTRRLPLRSRLGVAPGAAAA